MRAMMNCDVLADRLPFVTAGIRKQQKTFRFSENETLLAWLNRSY